jgi:arylsulfatase
VVSHTEGFDIGEDTISAVDDSYSVESSRFNGQIDKLTVTLK